MKASSTPLLRSALLLTLWPAACAPLPARRPYQGVPFAADRRQSASVTARVPWQDTAVTLSPGDEFFLDARGTWTGGVGLSCGPAGSTAPGGGLIPVRGPALSLVGKIGEGAPFVVGDQYLGRAQQGGNLYLGMNDWSFFDNSGELAVEIHVKGGASVVAAPREEPKAPPAAAAPLSDVDEPKYREAESPDDLALVVGVENYSKLPGAPFAERDARAVAKHLAALGYPPRKIVQLIGKEATGTTLKGYLEEWLPRNVQPHSRVFFYFSGHGAPDPKTGEAYLVPWDGDPMLLKSTAYPLKELYGELSRLKAKEVIVAVDSCYSGAGGRSVLAKGARPLVAAQAGAALPPNLLVLAATQGAQISTSAAEKGHGLFTYHFLKALKDGKKDVVEIFQHISPLVEDDAKALNVSQTPSLSPEGRPARTRFRLRN